MSAGPPMLCAQMCLFLLLGMSCLFLQKGRPLLGAAPPQGRFPVQDEGQRASFLPSLYVNDSISGLRCARGCVYNSPPLLRLSQVPLNVHLMCGGDEERTPGEKRHLQISHLVSSLFFKPDRPRRVPISYE